MGRVRCVCWAVGVLGGISLSVRVCGCQLVGDRSVCVYVCV